MKKTSKTPRFSVKPNREAQEWMVVDELGECVEQFHTYDRAERYAAELNGQRRS